MRAPRATALQTTAGSRVKNRAGTACVQENKYYVEHLSSVLVAALVCAAFFLPATPSDLCA
jgi:hypothetical protein